MSSLRKNIQLKKEKFNNLDFFCINIMEDKLLCH